MFWEVWLQNDSKVCRIRPIRLSCILPISDYGGTLCICKWRHISLFQFKLHAILPWLRERLLKYKNFPQEQDNLDDLSSCFHIGKTHLIVALSIFGTFRMSLSICNHFKSSVLEHSIFEKFRLLALTSFQSAITSAKSVGYYSWAGTFITYHSVRLCNIFWIIAVAVKRQGLLVSYVVPVNPTSSPACLSSGQYQMYHTIRISRIWSIRKIILQIIFLGS